MKCIRCKKEFDTEIPVENTRNFGTNLYACPYCGKLYKFYRTISVSCYDLIDNEVGDRKTDNWGNKIILDKDYEMQKM